MRGTRGGLSVLAAELLPPLSFPPPLDADLPPPELLPPLSFPPPLDADLPPPELFAALVLPAALQSRTLPPPELLPPLSFPPPLDADLPPPPELSAALPTLSDVFFGEAVARAAFVLVAAGSGDLRAESDFRDRWRCGLRSRRPRRGGGDRRRAARAACRRRGARTVGRAQQPCERRLRGIEETGRARRASPDRTGDGARVAITVRSLAIGASPANQTSMVPGSGFGSYPVKSRASTPPSPRAGSSRSAIRPA